MFKASLSRFKIFAGAAVVLFLFLIMLALSFRRFNDLANANFWDTHTYQVLLGTSNMMRGLVNVQTGSRGFVQSGEEEFLEPYHTGRKEFDENYRAVLGLTADNSVQQKRLQLLKRQYDIWLRGQIEPLIKMRRAITDDVAALRYSQSGSRKRKATMDAMQKTVSSIETMERDLLAERRAAGAMHLRMTKATLLFNGAFAVV